MRKLFRVLSFISFIACACSSCDPVFAITKTPAKDISANVSGFDGNLSETDTDVQKALQTLNDMPVVGSETDPVFSSSEAASITSTDTTNWDTAYGWGDHAGLYLPINGEAASVSGLAITPGASISGNNTGDQDLSSYLTSATAASTYATIASLSSYLTTATAASTYQPIGSYLTAETDPLSLHLDQTTPQTVTASPIFNWGTANRIPYYSATKTLTDSANLTYNGTTLTNSITSTRTTPGQDIALGANVYWNGASNSHMLTRVIGFGGGASVVDGNSKNLSNLYGFYFSLSHFGSGTITNASAMQIPIELQSGSITNLRGAYIGTLGDPYYASTPGTTVASYKGIDLYGDYSQCTFTNAYHIYIENMSNTISSGGGSLANQYGIYIEDLTSGGTVDYGIVIAGADTGALWLGAGSAVTTSADGIIFGSGKDVNLYRSGANTLKTDDTLSALKFTSTQATGTSPFSVTSTTVNANLNADKWDGLDAPANAVGVLTNDGSGNMSWGAANIVEDLTPQLGGDLDGNAKDITGVVDFEAKSINADLTIGAEKLNNPAFTGNANSWTLGSGWAYSANTVVKSGANVGTLSQAVGSMASGMTNGHEYRLSFDADSLTAGYFSVSIGGRTFPRFNTGSKTFTWDFICTDNTLPLTVTPINGYTSISAVTLDNFSLKEIYDGSTQTGYISTEKDANVTRYLKGANESAFCKVSFGYGNGGDGVFQLLDFAGIMFSQDGNFAILDPGNNFDYKTNMYVVPVTGYYKATIKVRVVDVTTEEPYPGYPDSSYGIGVDVWETYGQWLNDEADTTPVYGDSPSLMWGDSAGSSSGGRNGMMNINYIHATAGQHIGMYGYSDAAQYATDGSMVIELLYAD